ncbi:MAG: NAD(P)H-quinone oxidoreductase [Rhodobacteraceae bacterium TMED111]|nr:NAD(P)H-quinone oxidoreductase [Marinovum sp.]OUV43546.1 MAG: NAD(P)H-quinone oxidoreductase [Rhodobacteraceae bacterium TMED111]
MTSMKVIEIVEPGGPSVLKSSVRNIPKPKRNEVLIKISYAGINRPDVLQRSGSYLPPPGASDLPGLEASGIIFAIGENVTNWEVGDEVCALLPGGGYAEYAVTQASHCLPVPTGMSLKQAAALPETLFTVWSNVFQRGGLKPNEKFLVHGGSSGIGTMAIQLANLFGSEVYATAGSEAKCSACEELGAIRAINYNKEDFLEVIKSIGGVHLILDMVGGAYIEKNIKALVDDGRLVQIAFLKGAKVELNFAQIMTRRLTVTGSTLRPQSDLSKSQIASELLEKIWPLLSTGRINPVINSVFDLNDVSSAHFLMESSKHIGKIVLKVDGRL